jgi:NAD(P)H-quinone oxidoreductase subunit 5
MLTLSTYLLVGFWYAQPLVVTAARDAFLTKRIGDVLAADGGGGPRRPSGQPQL